METKTFAEAIVEKERLRLELHRVLQEQARVEDAIYDLDQAIRKTLWHPDMQTKIIVDRANGKAYHLDEMKAVAASDVLWIEEVHLLAEEEPVSVVTCGAAS